MDISSSYPSQMRVQPSIVDLSRDKNSSQMIHAIKPINDSATTPVVIANHAISFHSDQETGRDYFIVKDKHTDKVIKQYPPEEMVKIARHLLQNGDFYQNQLRRYNQNQYI